MPAQRFEAEELDRATLDYLHHVVQSEGQGMPGLYFDTNDAPIRAASMPLWGLLAAPIVIGLTLLATWGSTRSVVPVALLMTGGLFLGGWLIVAWVRCFIASRRNRYIGFFQYVDPLYLWSGQGGAVEVEPIDLLIHAEAIGSRVRIEKADGNLFLELRTTGLATEVEEYLIALRDQTAPEPVKRGYAALALLRDEGDEEDEDRVVAIPSPLRARSAHAWIVPIVLLGALVGLFFGCKMLATQLRDDAVFELVKDKDPAHLRIYLIDENNIRHRDAVMERLERFHEQVARSLEERQADPQLRAGLANLVRGLKKEARPIITVGFVTAEKSPRVPEGYLSPAVISTLNQKIVLDLRKAIQPLTRVPATPIPDTPPQPPIDLVDFALAFEGTAMITIEARVHPGKKEPRECGISWTITFQPDPEAEKQVATFETKLRQTGEDATPSVRALYGNLGEEVRKRLGL